MAAAAAATAAAATAGRAGRAEQRSGGPEAVSGAASACAGRRSEDSKGVGVGGEGGGEGRGTPPPAISSVMMPWQCCMRERLLIGRRDGTGLAGRLLANTQSLAIFPFLSLALLARNFARKLSQLLGLRVVYSARKAVTAENHEKMH